MEIIKGEAASICQGVRGSGCLRQAEERDVVSGREVNVIGVLELLGDLQSLGALVIACPILFVAVYAYLHA